MILKAGACATDVSTLLQGVVASTDASCGSNSDRSRARHVARYTYEARACLTHIPQHLKRSVQHASEYRTVLAGDISGSAFLFPRLVARILAMFVSSRENFLPGSVRRTNLFLFRQ